MKRTILIFCCVFCTIAIYAQKETNWWYFGYNSGLNFNELSTINGVTNMPKAVPGPLSTVEGCFTLSDSGGNLLMSSDGITVYNKQNQQMENGSGLLGHSSATQSGIVIPKPGSSTEYYIVTVAVRIGENANAKGINYSIADLSANGGLGKITTKNVQLLPSPLDENIAGILNANGKDFWLVHNTGRFFYVWAITAEAGFSATPQIYDIGFTPVIDASAALGTLKFSSDNTRFARPTYTGKQMITGFFDTSTGVVSGVKATNLASISTKPYALEFSPSGEYIFYNTSESGPLYRVSFNDARNGLFGINTTLPISNVQLSPDGRIYGIRINTRTLYVIMNPDEGGTDIRTMDNFLVANATYGLPTFAASFFNAKPVSPKAFTCAGYAAKLSIETTFAGIDVPTYFTWDFGDGSSLVTQAFTAGTTTYTQKHTYDAAGTYRITVTPYKTGSTMLADKVVTFRANIVNCNIVSNRMIRDDMLNTARMNQNQ